MPIRHRILRPRPASLVPILFGILTLLAGATASAQKDPRAEAKAHYTSGKKLFEQGEYEKAIAEFQAADQLAPSGVNDFNIGLAYEALGQEAEALRHYRSYLQRVPDASNKASVEASVAKLEAAVAAEEEARLAEEEARRAAAEEEARRIEAEKTGGGTTGTTGTTGGTTPPPATGDPELDRVAAVDVGQVRDRSAVATIGGGGGAAAGGTGAVGPPPTGTGAGAPPPPPPAGGEPPKSKPIYKKWWFWVVVGVSAYVLISIVTADSDEPQPLQGRLDRMMPMPVQGASGGGATVWRF